MSPAEGIRTLSVLVENAGCLLRKEDLLRQVWPYTVVEENNLTKNISLLRKALGEPATGQSYIETVLSPTNRPHRGRSQASKDDRSVEHSGREPGGRIFEFQVR